MLQRYCDDDDDCAQKSALKQRVSDIYAGAGGDWGLFISGLHELNNVILQSHP